MTAITIHFDAVAEKIARTVKTATVSAFDAWGAEHTYVIEWMPRIVRGVALSYENIGKVPVVWASECPVYASRSKVHGNVGLKEPAVQVAFDRAEVVAPMQVDDASELTPGTYRILSES